MTNLYTVIQFRLSMYFWMYM